MSPLSTGPVEEELKEVTDSDHGTRRGEDPGLDSTDNRTEGRYGSSSAYQRLVFADPVALRYAIYKYPIDATLTLASNAAT